MKATDICEICNEIKPLRDLMPTEFIRPSLAKLIEAAYPNRARTGFICTRDLNRLRVEYVRQALEAEVGEISTLENAVIRSLRQEEFISSNIYAEFDDKLTTADKISDKVAAFGGSWRFILAFVFVISVWITLNSIQLASNAFDPYPYILLNLLLSCVAAFQAPIIMMSQNRMEARDRMRSEHDYKVNLKAELEIRHLHEKLDHLLQHQWGRLMEIQELQMEIMKEVAETRRRG